MSNERLTHKQKLFIEAFLGKAKGNGVEAARIAGYKGNDVTLAAVSYENLRKPHIAEMVQKRVERVTMSANQVLEELTDIAACGWRENTIIQLRDKIRALELLGKYHKLFTEKVDHTIAVDGLVARLQSDLPEIPAEILQQYASELLQ